MVFAGQLLSRNRSSLGGVSASLGDLAVESGPGVLTVDRSRPLARYPPQGFERLHQRLHEETLAPHHRLVDTEPLRDVVALAPRTSPRAAARAPPGPSDRLDTASPLGWLRSPAVGYLPKARLIASL
jgi:hypothetical protein